MGTTLQHGIFLPAEGERNCYTGLASNWTILDGVVGGYSAHAANLTIHVTAADKEAWNGKAEASALTAHAANATIHVTAADKEAWNGKADASALTAHTGNTTIHVTAEDKAKWNGKANDTDVMHKSGDETAAGIKTFSDATYVKSLNFTNNVPNPSSSSYSQFFITNTITYTSGDPSVTARVNFRVLANGTISIFPHENDLYSLGLQSRRFKDFYTYLVNGNNPGALSLPNLSAGVDISGYFTPGTTENTYTPTVNGWVSIRGTSSETSGMYVENSKGFYASANSMVAYTGTDRYVNLCFPVISGESYNIVFKSVNTSIVAKFFPCLGNA